MSISLHSAAAALQATPAVSQQAQSMQPATAPQAADFGHALTHAIDRIDALKTEALATGQEWEKGAPGVSLDRVMVGTARADLALNLGVQVRNRVVSAYREIMSMQV